MNIQFSNYKTTNVPSFKGYDARNLRGFLMASNYGNIANILSKIGKKEGFDVFIIDGINPVYTAGDLKITEKFTGEWVQDFITILKDNKLLSSDIGSMDHVLSFFNLKLDKVQKYLYEKFDFNKYRNILKKLSNATPINENEFKISTTDGKEMILSMDELIKEHNKIFTQMNTIASDSHIQGGNVFIAKNKEGKELILVGHNEFVKFYTDDISQMFSNRNIEFIPQADFHLDMFMRPLNNGKILLADDNLTLKLLDDFAIRLNDCLNNSEYTNHKKEVKKIIKEIKSFKNEFKNELSKNSYEKTTIVEEKLQKLGFDVIKVPGRCYYTENESLNHLMNFMNANVLVNKDNELVYITNEPFLEIMTNSQSAVIKKLKILLQNEFYKYIEPYVKKEHTYFISGENNALTELLLELRGGIHCLCTEIPKFN